MRRVRLTADVIKDSADLRVHVRIFREQLAKASEVVGVPSHVRGDKCRFRIPAEEIVALGHQLVEARKLVLRIAAPGKQRQLEPALVGEVDRRTEEFLRIRSVYEDGNAEPGARGPDRVERRVVDLQSRAVSLPYRQAESLPDLADTNGSGGDICLELLYRPLGPPGSDISKIDARENANSILHFRRSSNRRHRPLKLLAGENICCDHHSNVDGVQRSAKPRQSFSRHDEVARMTVVVNRGKLRARNRMRRRYESRNRPVVQNARRRGLRRATDARPDLRRS